MQPPGGGYWVLSNPWHSLTQSANLNDYSLPKPRCKLKIWHSRVKSANGPAGVSTAPDAATGSARRSPARIHDPSGGVFGKHGGPSLVAVEGDVGSAGPGPRPDRLRASGAEGNTERGARDRRGGIPLESGVLPRRPGRLGRDLDGRPIRRHVGSRPPPQSLPARPPAPPPPGPALAYDRRPPHTDCPGVPTPVLLDLQHFFRDEKPGFISALDARSCGARIVNAR